ncbi:c-type cytochrome [Coralloluteibacterium stylophorae]|uniref:Cytochrome c4 n=1 Tax=Coralloluteibacterium stylophorae TaxID=1776034 RepID=A0A8J7VST7_9GAMM|nr:c-type cytochrome [Coralloluteibacterium stylophorae]MBS7455524.1 cytochrome c4 [Coralloluteibacterium stylophorae]
MIRTLIALLALATGAGLAAPAAAQSPDIGERLEGCAACHGERGEGVGGTVYYPHLAGKPAGYLFEQLRGFRDGRRHFPPMTYLVQYMDDAWLREISGFYAAQPVPRALPHAEAAPMTATQQARARILVREGDPDRDIPPCSACHGETLEGLEPGVPAIVGLPADYVIAQMGSWRTGLRQGAPPDCMATVANRLSLADITLIAQWLSRQPHAADARPAPAASFEPPLACGSLSHAETAR